MSMITCPNCGRPISATTRFCGGCGAATAGPTETASATATAMAPPPIVGSPIAESDSVHPKLMDCLMPGETVEIALSVQRGGIAVTPTRIAVVEVPESSIGSSGTQLVHIIERRAVQHLASGKALNVGQILFGILFIIAGMFSIFHGGTDNQTGLVVLGFVAVLAGIVMCYLATNGAVLLADTTGFRIRIPLKRSELSRSHAFIAQLGTTLGS